MWKDLLFAFKTLRRSPGFVVLSVLTLALGIGANTAIFSLLYQVILRSVPVKNPGELVFLQKSNGSDYGFNRSDNSKSVFSYPMYRELRDRNPVFSGLVARESFPSTLAYHGEARSTLTEVVTGNFFDVLGIQPVLGRLLVPADDSLTASNPVIVLSYNYWSGHLGSDRGVLNSQILMNGHPVLIVGVAPPGFLSLVSGSDPDFYAPVSMMPLISDSWQKRTDQPDAAWLNLIGRLKPGVNEQQAGKTLQALYRTVLAEQLPRFQKLDAEAREKLLRKTLVVLSAAQGLNELRETLEAPLLVLMVMVSLVLLIACANVANLLIARGISRQKEIAVRLAIGATRWQLFRQLLVESLLLSLAAAAVGLLVSDSVLRGLIASLPADATGGWLAPQPNDRVLWFSVGLALLTGILFGFVPALQSTRPNLAHTLKEQSAAVGSGRSQSRVREILVVGQICLSLLLLIGAGLFTRSLVNLLYGNPGFQTSRLVRFTIDPSLNGYNRQRILVLFRELEQKLQNLPGVAGTARSVFAPFAGMNWGTGVKLPGETPKRIDAEIRENGLSAGYFSTMGITLMSGREFTSADTETSPKVAVLNEKLAKLLFGKQDPVGRQFLLGPEETPTQVIGVVRNTKNGSMREDPNPFVYVPFDQADKEIAMQATFNVRTRGSEQSVMGSIRGAMKQLDSGIPVQDLSSFTEVISQSLYMDRLIAILAASFGCLATLLAAIGLYGTISYAVTMRTREFGIRLALGADRENILKLVLTNVGIMVAIGTLIGLPGSYASARLVESQLYGIHAGDPLVLAGGTLLIVIAAIVASLVPALRAIRIDPVRALRYE